MSFPLDSVSLHALLYGLFCGRQYGIEVPFLAAVITDASCGFRFGSAPYTAAERVSIEIVGSEEEQFVERERFILFSL